MVFLTILINTILSTYFSSRCVLFLKDEFATVQYIERPTSIVNILVKNNEVQPELIFVNHG